MCKLAQHIKTPLRLHGASVCKFPSKQLQVPFKTTAIPVQNNCKVAIIGLDWVCGHTSSAVANGP
jgi:hypothetical protein